MQHFQRWLQKGWTRAVLDHNDDFDKGRAALSWTGHWAYPPYLKALGKDLVLQPLSDFGRGIKTGMGSWAWGMSSTCREPAGAWAFLTHLLSPAEILNMTNVNGAIPARYSTLIQSPLYGTGGPLRMFVRQLEAARPFDRVFVCGPLRMFVRQLEAGGVPRPHTPAYGMLSRTVAAAVSNIIAGGDVQSELSKAAANIDSYIATHRGYPYP